MLVSPKSRPIRRAGVSLAVLALTGCQPGIRAEAVESTEEGVAKVGVARVQSAWCRWQGVEARFRPLGEGPFNAGGSSVERSRSGAYSVQAATLPGTESARVGGVFEVEWTLTWYDTSRWGCPRTPRTVTARRRFVVTPAFQLRGEPNPLDVPQGGTALLDLLVERAEGFTSPVDVAAFQATASDVAVSPASVPIVDGSSQVKVDAAPSLALGTHSLAFQATLGMYSASNAIVSLNVQRAFTLAAAPGRLDLRQGGSAPLELLIDRHREFRTPVTVTATAADGIAVSPVSQSVPGEEAPVEVSVGPRTAAGSYTISLDGTAGAFSPAGAAVALDVQPAFTLAVPTEPIELSPGTAASIRIDVRRGSGFTDAVVVAPLALAAGVTVTPSSNSVTGTSADFSLSATPGTATAAHDVTFRASSGPYIPREGIVTLNVARPAVTGVSPNAAPRGGTVTIAGSDFSTACGDNVVRVGGQTAEATGCTATSIVVAVPTLAPYGDKQVTVTRNGLTSDAAAFRVTHLPGDFTDISYDILTQRSSGRLCSTGEVRLDITGSYTARYVRVATGATIGSRSFDRDSRSLDDPHSDPTVTYGNSGGAGFSGCAAGIVFDPDAGSECAEPMAFRFVKLVPGPGLPGRYCVEYFSGQEGYNSYEDGFGIHRSPDGTVLVIVSPDPSTFAHRVALIDVVTGRIFRQFQVDEFDFFPEITLSDADRVTLIFGAAGTTWGPYALPD